MTSYHWAYCPYGGWFLNGNQSQGSASVVPYVQIKLTTVSPNTIYIGGNPNSATITVTVFHQGIQSGSSGSVTLEVGTGVQDPQGAATLSYTPTSYVLIYAGGQASGDTDTTFTVDSPNGSSSTVTVQADLIGASGVTIKDPNPATNANATLNVVKP